MKKTSIILSIILVTFMNLNIFAQDQEVSEADKTRLEIQELINAIKEKNKKVHALFDEAKSEADNLKRELDEKLNILAKAMKKAKFSKSYSKTDINKAIEFEKEAKIYYKKHDYRQSLDYTNKALVLISKYPIVSINVEPQVFSPQTDTLEITHDIYTRKKIVSWELLIKKPSGKEDVILKKFEGEGSPPSKITWDGKIDGKIAVDSATYYNVELKATNEDNGVGTSGDLNFKTDIFVEDTERGLLINVSSIHFDSNKYNLKFEYKPIVQQVYDFLLEYPGYKIIVEGHTDNEGSTRSNLTLSQNRAKSVSSYLATLGMDWKRMIIRGLGENLPITLLASKLGLNRRVSFILLKDAKDLEKYDAFVKKINFRQEINMQKDEEAQ